MSILAIILLIILGIFLLLVEFLIIPGVTIAGIGGFLIIGGAVFASYYFHGTKTGNYTLLSTLVFFIFTVVFALKSKTWNKAMLGSQIDSTVDNIKKENIVQIGSTGKTITRLNPIGKVIIGEKYYEAKSTGGYIPQNTEIEVTKVLNTNIVVKPKK
ncbi:MAG: NfeD family protein [Bacteroidales bacterium]|nr:NfeD family protein [Bacteroidales bacterium]